MAIKTAKEKLDGHTHLVNNSSSEATTNKVEEVKINEYDTIKIYNNQVIFDEQNPDDNPPSSLQNYQGEVFFMTPPFAMDNAIANNDWMSDSDDKVDRFTAMEEWLRLYKDLSSIGMVYLTPTHPKLQDQTYISNGIWVVEHDRKYCFMPNFRAEGRKRNDDLGIPGENAINAPFMQMLGYNLVYLPEEIDGEPCYFEGSADIKLINSKDEHGCVYLCGTGIRTSENAARWIENKLNELDPDPNSHHKVISYPQKNSMMYHIDCCVMPLDANHTMIYTNDLDPEVLAEIEKYTIVLPVTEKDIAEAGVCNVVVAGGTMFVNSDINLLEGSEYIEDYNIEKKKIAFQQDICNKLGLNLNVYCMSSNILNGACLSCNVDNVGYSLLKENNWYYKY